MNFYFERIVRLKDLEVWDLRFKEDLYRLFILDERRIPHLNELDLPNQFIKEDLRKNLITASAYSKNPVKESQIEFIDQFVKQITDHVALAHCYVILNFYTGDIDAVFKDILKEKEKIIYEDIPLCRLWHLNQN